MTPDRTDDGVLEPEDLVLEESDDRVTRLDENRYVVRPDGLSDGPGLQSTLDRLVPDRDPDRQPETAQADATRAESTADAATAANVLESASEPHGVDVTLKTGGEIAHHCGTSHDVREVFVDLLTWYADQLDDDLSPGEALQVMVAASDLEV